MSGPVFRVGTRGSQLAMTQSRWAAEAVSRAGGIDHELVTVRTEGDVLTGPLSQMGGTGVFATALRSQVLDGAVDLAVHSLKDLPTAAVTGLTIAALPQREDPRDALCARDGLTLDELPEGAAVGTGSPRRVAQLRALRPDLRIVDIRGNVGTRLNRVAPGDPGDLDAVVLAASGLKRLGLEGRITEYLDPHRMLPAPGQGALALEVSAELTADSGLATGLAAVDHLPTRLAVTAERSVLARLEAGCAAPVGTFARLVDGDLELDVVVANPDGSEVMRRTESAREPSVEAARALGQRVADDLLAHGADRLARLSL
ncbi:MULTISPECIES: hydroxymethylbilane synthase [Kocuria]|uniref:Porphobilinogen deaminase n=1 Tax=Kocuria marina subsp. indica TaxID=1049583 RepID=A0A1X7DRJ9_9MICC|nr:MULTISPECIES: hydroxymethylbilane synthase [Kocuria]MBN6811350.1 hydroxymethylbilane synthase [Kocuria indica]MBN6843044.1 hydroxymethylbilane synthase [Kocuria indica]MCG7432221.1 hydroxymethylbilane synthase [Kocuria indica]OXS81635.1 hydroxymethylbilane synthase [Kocuria indica]RLP57213.1 hydroxymethylbilane synthase [Kocuria indica]